MAEMTTNLLHRNKTSYLSVFFLGLNVNVIGRSWAAGTRGQPWKKRSKGEERCEVVFVL